MRFNLFRVNIFSIRKDDYVFLAAGDEQVCVRVEVTQIAGVKPAVLQYLGSRFRTVPVTLHDDRTAD